VFKGDGTGGALGSSATANAVLYLNGTKKLTSGSALTFDGTNFATTGSGTLKNLLFSGGTLPAASNPSIALRSSDNIIYHQAGSANNITFLDSAQNTMQSISATANIFNISNAEGMRLTSTGLGIGTSSPATKLTVSGSSAIITADGTTNNGARGLDFVYQSQSYGSLLNYAFTGETALTAGYVGSSGYFLTFKTEGVERARINSSGNLLVGTTSGSDRLVVNGSAGITGGRGTSYSLKFADWLLYNTSSGGNFTFSNYTTELMTLTQAGDLLLGTTSQISTGFFCLSFANNARNGIVINDTDTGGGTNSAMIFRRNGSQVGSISTTTTATAYNTSSDYRLKNTIAPMTGALDKVALLKPCTYKWNVNGSDGQGFIAHELQAVVPECVVGEKDAVDKDGNPKYQGVDTSFLVATLTAAIQEQQAIIESLKARLDAANL